MYSAVSCAARRVLACSRAQLLSGAQTSRQASRTFVSGTRNGCRPALPTLSPKRRHGERCGTCFRTFASSKDAIQTEIAGSKVVVYGKTWCGFSQDVVILLEGLGVKFESIELDNIPEGMDLQDALYEMTGVSTVPQVFIGGKFVGGCDETVSAYKSGELKAMFEEAGVASKL